MCLAGGPGWTGHVESIADLRAHCKDMRGIKPIPEWVYKVLDNIEEDELSNPGGPDAPVYKQAMKLSDMHYVKYHEHVAVLPNNFVALGDAHLRLNPVFGQGMAKTAVEVTILDSVLRRIARPSPSAAASTGLIVSPSFFKSLHARVGGTWKTTKFGDYANDCCEPASGETLAVGAGMRAFNSKVGKRAIVHGDLDVQRRMMGVRAWVLPPTDIIASPSVLGKLALDYVLGRN
jgi:hypothetical protein